MALEVTLQWGWNKQTAVREVIAHVAADGAGTLYAGDGANDAEAMEAVVALGGVALGIGPEAPSVAPYRLPDPTALVDFLEHLYEALASDGRQPSALPGTPGHRSISGVSFPQHQPE